MTDASMHSLVTVDLYGTDWSERVHVQSKCVR